jgi:hypothetical protein
MDEIHMAKNLKRENFLEDKTTIMQKCFDL